MPLEYWGREMSNSGESRRWKYESNSQFNNTICTSSINVEHHNYLLLPCNLSDSSEVRVKAKAFLDCGCTTTSLIDIDICAKFNISTQILQSPRKLITADGSESISGLITHSATLTLHIGDHWEIIEAFVTKLGNYDFILGFSWLQ